MKIVTIGEIMLRLQPPGFGRFIQTKEFEAVYGGGEANVAVSLAGYGDNALFLTRLPDNPIGDACLAELRKHGVDVSLISRGGERLGIYFCEKGASQRPSKVVYDRAGSSFATAKIKDINYRKAIKGADWLHFTGITPALSDTTARLTLDVLKEAKAKNVTVSCDLNYRKKLWSKENAGKVMSELMPYVDVLIANEEDAKDVFGIETAGSDITKGSLDHVAYRNVCEQLTETFGFKKTAITLRESISASVNNWSAMLYNGSEAMFSEKYRIDIVDRVGGGDSFAAGLIHCLAGGKSDREALEFATAASCLKHTVEGDFNLVSEEEVVSLMKGDGSGRVQR